MSDERNYMESRSEDKIRGWERHIGAAAQAVVLVVLIWTGNSLIGLREQVAVMQVKVTTLQDTVSSSTGTSRPRFEAERDSDNLRTDLNKLTNRVDKLEYRSK
jgi:hypothetical protein